MGNKIWRFGFYSNDEIKAISLLVKVEAKRGTFLLVPHGPTVKNNIKKEEKEEVLKSLLKKTKEIAKEEKAVFLRVSPIWKRNEENNDIFKSIGFKKAPIHAHPEASWKLNIEKKEEDLMLDMRKTTRYLIRKAKKEDIQIIQSNNTEDLPLFEELYKEVVKMQHFVPFSENYLKKEMSSFKEDDEIRIFFAKYKKKIIASSFVIFNSDIGFYHHAALSPEYRKIPVSYLMQWEAIKEAKRRGCFLYDFWGYVSPKENPNHPWAGPTLFKMGFGGQDHLYVKTQDFPFSPKYYLTYIFEKIRKIKRGL
jgi:lipid II:glycine glycyltransferase (peptidoglycan interpeptide bridge formation enzyme)